MKRFILKTLLLLLPIAILAASMEYLLQHIPKDYIYKKNYLDKHSGEIQILILGASDAYYGINPDYFSQNTFNACHVSQSLDLDYEIFKKYQNNFTDLKVIIISVSYSTLWGQLKGSPESWRLKNYALYYGINTKSLGDYSELLNVKLRMNFQRLYDYYFKKKNEIHWSELGWGTAYKSENTGDLDESGKERALSHYIDDIHSKEKTKIFKENMEILNSFAEFCNRKNGELILLTIPTYHTYSENLNKEQLNTMVNTLNDFVEKHNNCRYINWLENPDFAAKDFYDANHLDEAGADKLSKKLVLYIDSLEIFK